MARIFIGGLARYVTERDIEEFIAGYGKFRQITVKQGFGFVEFVDYKDADDVVHALNGKRLAGDRVTVEHSTSTAFRNDRRPIGGYGGSSGSGRDNYRRDRDNRDYRDSRDGGRRAQQRSPVKYDRPSSSKYRVRIENLSSSITWRHLKDLMRKAGEVTYTDAHTSRRNEGIVHFASRSDLKNAIKMFDGREVCGRKIRLSEESAHLEGGNGKRRHSTSPSRSPSRSRTRSRERKISRVSRSSSPSVERVAKRDAKSRSISRTKNKKVSHASRSRSRSPKRQAKAALHDDASPSRSRSREADENGGSVEASDDEEDNRRAYKRSLSRSSSRD